MTMSLSEVLWPFFPRPGPKPKPAHVMPHESYHKFLMGIQVTSVVEEEVVSRLDSDAEQRGMSRSKFIAHILSEYAAHRINVDSNVEKLTVQVQEKEHMIEELKARVSWLEGHISMLMTERDRLLPAPKRGFWSWLRGSG